MKIKISNHNKKKYEINEILRIVKVETFIVQIRYNDFFRDQRIRENKKKQRKKKSLHYQNLKNFSISMKNFVLHSNDIRSNIFIFLFFLNIKISIFSITFVMTFEKINA